LSVFDLKPYIGTGLQEIFKVIENTLENFNKEKAGLEEAIFLAQSLGVDLNEIAKIVGEYRILNESDTTFFDRVITAIQAKRFHNTEDAIKSIVNSIMDFDPVYKTYPDFDFTYKTGKPYPGIYLGIQGHAYDADLGVRMAELEKRVNQSYKTAGVRVGF
jgi:hypothetical protein